MATSEPKLVRLNCPNCGARMKVDEASSGKRGRCHTCRNVFRIPNFETDRGHGFAAFDQLPDAFPPQEAAEVQPVIETPPERALPSVSPVMPPQSNRRNPVAGVRNRAETPIVQQATLDIGAYRHPREKVYLVIAAVISGLIWLVGAPILILVAVFAIPVMISLLISMWVAGQFFRARIMGNCVRVSEHQHGDIHAVAAGIASQFGMRKMPEIFLVNSEGAVNALAIRFVGSRFVILYSSLVDLMLSRGQLDELKMIIAHELAHHAAGHNSLWKTTFLKPAMFVPFLGSAYRRACELSADRIALAVTNNFTAGRQALANLASGSIRLAGEMNLDALIRQEDEIPSVLGFLNDIYASHPRITRRLVELESYAVRAGMVTPSY